MAERARRDTEGREAAEWRALGRAVRRWVGVSRLRVVRTMMAAAGGVRYRWEIYICRYTYL